MLINEKIIKRIVKEEIKKEIYKNNTEFNEYSDEERKANFNALKKSNNPIYDNWKRWKALNLGKCNTSYEFFIKNILPKKPSYFYDVQRTNIEDFM